MKVPPNIEGSCRRIAKAIGVPAGRLSSMAKELVLEDARWPSHDQCADPVAEYRSAFTLHPGRYELLDYQREVVSQLERSFQPRSKAMVSLPTGGGKTRTALVFLLERFAQNSKISMRWLAPSHELVAQAISALEQLWSRAPLAVSMNVTHLDQSDERRPGLQFGTIQLGARRGAKNDAAPQILVVDEAHRVAANSFARVVRHSCSSGSFVVGLSATPGRSSPKESDRLVDLFDGRLLVPPSLGRDPIGALRARGVLVEPNVVDISAVPGESTVIGNFLREIVNYRGISGIAFAPSIPDCYAIAAALNSAGKTSSVVSHEQPLALRRERLRLLAAKKIDWLVNVELLSTGIDIPSLDAIALLAPVGSPVSFEQIVGRSTRGPAVGGKDRAIIFDGFRHFDVHGDVCSYSRPLFGRW